MIVPPEVANSVQSALCRQSQHQLDTSSAPAAFPSSSDGARSDGSAAGSHQLASTSGRGGARDTGIQLAVADEYNPDKHDVRNAMQKYLPEGVKRRVLGA